MPAFRLVIEITSSKTEELKVGFSSPKPVFRRPITDQSETTSFLLLKDLISTETRAQYI